MSLLLVHQDVIWRGTWRSACKACRDGHDANCWTLALYLPHMNCLPRFVHGGRLMYRGTWHQNTMMAAMSPLYFDSLACRVVMVIEHVVGVIVAMIALHSASYHGSLADVQAPDTSKPLIRVALSRSPGARSTIQIMCRKSNQAWTESQETTSSNVACD